MTWKLVIVYVWSPVFRARVQVGIDHVRPEESRAMAQRRIGQRLGRKPSELILEESDLHSRRHVPYTSRRQTGDRTASLRSPAPPAFPPGHSPSEAPCRLFRLTATEGATRLSSSPLFFVPELLPVQRSVRRAEGFHHPAGPAAATRF
jgi:hypothetical protein